LKNPDTHNPESLKVWIFFSRVDKGSNKPKTLERTVEKIGTGTTVTTLQQQQKTKAQHF
jgi:hypothetical protein